MISIPLHTHDCTIRVLSGTGAPATGLFLFHRVIPHSYLPGFKKKGSKQEEPEVWKPFTDGYEVSNRGYVRSRRQVLVNLLDSRGEPFQKIRGKWYRVKRLVADAFIPNLDAKRRLRHINGNLHDCRAENLEWW